MSPVHAELAAGRWNTLTLFEQMANIGSEVERALKWKNKGHMEYFRLAFDRALELLDLSLSDAKNLTRLKELARVREMLADFFLFGNSHGSTDDLWRRYFMAFNFAARRRT